MRRKHQLALCSLRQHLAGIRVDNFCDKMILVDVHTGLRAAFIRNTRAGKLRQAVDIIRLDAEALLDILTHLLTPCFCAENTGLQMDLVPQAALVNRFSQIRRVGRCAAQNRSSRDPP